MWILLFFSLSFSSSIERWVFLGDSLTEGYGISKENAYPAKLETLLNAHLKDKKTNRQIQIVNAGISGSTSASGLSRLKWQLKQPTALVLIALGANDGLRGQPIAALKKNLTDMVEYAKSQKVKVVLAGMRLPQNYGAKYTNDFEKSFKEVSSSQKVLLLPFLLEGVAGKKDLNLSDGLHPNEKGHEALSKNLFLFFKDL